jgi:ACS family hexuronate transporter-like MFS transporter
VNPAELGWIESDPPEPTGSVAWSQLFLHRETWAFAIGKFLTDPIWWLYLFWVPDFLKRNHGLDLKTMGLPLVAIYLVADVGSVGGGWLSSHLLWRGWSTNAARKTAMLVCALAVVPIWFAATTTNLWVAVALVSLAAAAHQGWSANLFTLASDLFPKRAVGSVVGIGGTAGSIGGMLIALVVGEILQKTGRYEPIFIMAACAYRWPWRPFTSWSPHGFQQSSHFRIKVIHDIFPLGRRFVQRCWRLAPQRLTRWCVAFPSAHCCPGRCIPAAS